MSIRVAILTNVLPTYRQGFYDRLFEAPELNVKVFCQDTVLGNKISTIHHRYGDKVRIVPTTHLLQGRIVWHHYDWSELFHNFDVVVVDGNLRHISQFFTGIYLRVRAKQIVIWSSLTHPGRPWGRHIRKLAWHMHRHFLMYTPEDARQLLASGLGHNGFVIPINNGLDQKAIEQAKSAWSESALEEWKRDKGLSNKRIIISSGRIEGDRFGALADALHSLIPRNPDLYWILIGDGSDREELESRLKKLGISEYTCLPGAIYDETALAPFFLSADLFVYPFAIGLSLMHAFGYGLPVITHDNYIDHGPEFSVFENDVTGRTYKYGDANDLAATMEDMLSDKSQLMIMGAAGLARVQTTFNIDVMVAQFRQMIASVMAD